MAYAIQPLKPTKREIREGGRCQRCLGMGYKGRREHGNWKIRNCPRCQGSGIAPNYERKH